jgi:hypothetical protein
VCSSCREYFVSQAKGTAKIIVIADSFGTALVFLPDGQTVNR